MPVGSGNYRFTRVVRTAPVVAMAALLGGAIGGFSVYAVSLALTDTPPHSTVAMKTDPDPARPLPHDAGAQTADGPAQNAVSPIRTIGTPPPNVTGPSASPAQPSQQIEAQQVQTPPLVAPVNPTPQAPSLPTAASQTQTTPWPDALSRAHPASPQPAVTAETQPPVSTPPAAPETLAAAPSKPVPLKPLPQKRRVVSRKPSPAPNRNGDELATRSQPVYDYYDDNDRDGDAVTSRGANSPPLDLNRLARAARHAKITGHDAAATRVVVRHQSLDSEEQIEVPRETRPMLPPQPRPPGLFGGIFGGGDRNDD
jgi:hypothetical protein